MDNVRIPSDIYNRLKKLSERPDMLKLPIQGLVSIALKMFVEEVEDLLKKNPGSSVLEVAGNLPKYRTATTTKK